MCCPQRPGVVSLGNSSGSGPVPDLTRSVLILRFHYQKSTWFWALSSKYYRAFKKQTTKLIKQGNLNILIKKLNAIIVHSLGPFTLGPFSFSLTSTQKHMHCFSFRLASPLGTPLEFSLGGPKTK